MGELEFSRGLPTFGVIIPARNAEQTLSACIAAVAASSVTPTDVIVYDDASSDNTCGVAEASGVRVICHGGPPRGPAAGRNDAAARLNVDVLVFVDADVTVHPDAIELLLESIAGSDTAAAFGSYDTAPTARRLAGQYTNLRHHHIHQNGERAASTFWSGLGAIRREDFLAIGGFDIGYNTPGIEDIELGLRLIEKGRRIRLVPEAQATHEKDWTLTETWRTDIFSRAIPWAALIASGRSRAVLNASSKEGVKAFIAHLVWIFVLLSVIEPFYLWLAALSGIGYLWLNRTFSKLLYRRGALPLLVVGNAMHWCYHVYASAILAAAQVASHVYPRKRAAAAGSLKI